MEGEVNIVGHPYLKVVFYFKKENRFGEEIILHAFTAT